MVIFNYGQRFTFAFPEKSNINLSLNIRVGLNCYRPMHLFIIMHIFLYLNVVRLVCIIFNRYFTKSKITNNLGAYL